MARQPRSDAQLLQFTSNLLSVWTGGQGGPPNIGLTSDQIAELAAAFAQAQSSQNAQTAARSAAKSASTGKRNAFKVLRKTLGGLINIIDGFAKSSNDPGVYQRAHIDPPTPPSPRDQAAMATSVSTKVRTDGSIKFAFKVRSGGGATYEIQRMIVDLDGTQGDWNFLTTSGRKKSFTDPTVPFGVRSISYRVRTLLSNGTAGEWSEPSTVNFGSQGSTGGPMAIQPKASQATTGQPKAAA